MWARITYVEKLTVTLATGDKNTLVDGQYAAQLSQNLLSRNPDFDPSKDLALSNRPYFDADGNPVNTPEAAAKLGKFKLYPGAGSSDGYGWQ